MTLLYDSLYMKLQETKSVVIKDKWLPRTGGMDCDDQESAQGKLIMMGIFCLLISCGHLGTYMCQNKVNYTLKICA